MFFSEPSQSRFQKFFNQLHIDKIYTFLEIEMTFLVKKDSINYIVSFRIKNTFCRYQIRLET